MGHGHLPKRTINLYPWIPPLLPDRGSVNITGDPQIKFSGVHLSNYWGNITATDIDTTVLVAAARQGNISLTNVNAS
eukprot:SAG31_NODE_34461_length_332_cov_1.553648_1_plen_76_part_10